LKSFPDSVSGNARIFAIWRLSLGQDFRILANLPSRNVHRFNPFVFLHQLK
jgi:hypothetical protein